METKSLEIANMISHQFRAALYMIGASQFLGVERGLQVKIGRNPKRIVKLQIVLASDDTYTIRTFNRAALETGEPTSEVPYVFADHVRMVIETETGLRTSL